AILTVGKSLVISEGQIDDFHKKILLEFKKTGMPEAVFQNSVSFGQKMAAHILAWASKDNYKETRSYPKYSVSDDEATWKPTPPSYMRAVEPHWNKIRTFLIDSAQQFKPLRAVPFSTDKNSSFYKEAAAVHDIGLKLTPEQKDIANFWDCNPFKMNVKGHVMFATKKISPGGHWINITRLACKKANADVAQSAEAYACVSITLADGFISCWDEKYRSNVIRPETYINQYIDADWVPLLQTPPFPEYTSGHSVISTASALMLTKLFSENFSFSDSTEIEFGLPVRHFKSFRMAAEEAAISRFYGGIHYMPSINNGIEEGNKIGNFITQRLRTKKEDIAGNGSRVLK
ncbi:MAG: vanadium-dependent haloperoxidase, partial [Flavisolibacter sp.]|nr:vanadium-dependent haloperoxidase [Flavisolibacter sp.]